MVLLGGGKMKLDNMYEFIEEDELYSTKKSIDIKSKILLVPLMKLGFKELKRLSKDKSIDDIVKGA